MDYKLPIASFHHSKEEDEWIVICSDNSVRLFASLQIVWAPSLLHESMNQETKEKSERLEKTLKKKLQLLAEVKFLRRKCQQFSAAPKTIRSKLEKQSQPQHSVFQKELSLKGRSQKGKHIPAQTSAALFDLNQISAPTAEEMEWFDQNAGMFKRFSREGGDALANDAMPSICRDSGIGLSRQSKRKVSWHDPLALRV
ncbi:hypothetical protein KSP39_PZI018010 [Platanthera zijinensis]|uniref:Uncharacterized protein n=1 Tax=Platanthera zijinensis TaxID=2320716 RepID=A0AAP0B2T2_9ASPA